MPLTQMASGGKWLQAPHDAPPVYLAPKQVEAHWKRLVGDGWTPCSDPRREEDQPQTQVSPVVQSSTTEVALRAEVDQLKALVQQLLAQKMESPEASTPETPAPKRGK